MEPEKEESIFNEIAAEFGEVSPFWRALSMSRGVLEPCWEAYEKLLASGDIPKRTKQMIAYECALADGCPKCRGGFTKLLQTVGIDEETINRLGRDIRSTGLDDETKEVLVYSYQAAKDPHSVDAKLVNAFGRLLGQNRLIEAGAWVNECKMLIDTAHSLNMHPLE